MATDLVFEWNLDDIPAVEFGAAIAGTVGQVVLQQMPDLADLFPFQKRHKCETHLESDWFAARIVSLQTPGIPIGGGFPAEKVDELKGKIGGNLSPSQTELQSLLGSEWVAADKFTYVGPLRDGKACWPQVSEQLMEWLNTHVLRAVQEQNRMRVLRVLPAPPRFDIVQFLPGMWVLECRRTCRQGTAFDLEGFGTVTCEHVLGDTTVAFKAHDPSTTFPVRLRGANSALDMAVLEIVGTGRNPLPGGSAASLGIMDHVAVLGFPNYRLGDTPSFNPGIVTAIRPHRGSKRILTNAHIVAGNSGGPVLNAQNKVIGIAVTGAERNADAPETEDHGIIPIEDLAHVTLR